MSDESHDKDQSPLSQGGNATGGTPRGPRVPRSLFLLLLLVAMLLFAISFVNQTHMVESTIGFAEFQSKYWDEEKHSYEGLAEAELRETTLYVRPFDPAVDGEAKESAESEDAEEKSTSEGEKAEAEEKATDEDEASQGNLLDQLVNVGPPEKWEKISLPPTSIDYEFMRDLATIPKFKVRQTNKWVFILLQYVIWLGIFIGFFYFLLIRPLRAQGGPGNVLSFGRSRPKLISKETTGVKFEDVAGVDEAKEDVQEVIEFLKNPEKFQKIGGRIPRGLLFVGPPGTGKTLLAKAIAGEADVPFYSICGSDFVEMFVGVGASRVRDLFRQAKENTPCIIFLDEVDAVGRRRGSGLGGGHDEREQTLNAILVEMDGFNTNEQVIVIAATNRPDVLDPALLRPGRFDREVIINLPDVNGRMEILKVHARHVKVQDDVDLMRIARGTPMFSGADLESLINEAAIRATMSNKDFVEQDDLEEARDKVRFGREKRSRTMDEADRRVTAYHEAGHAMITRLCDDVEPLHKVTIIPRGASLGSTMMLPLKDRYTITRKQLLGQIKVCFGGRIAEDIFCDDVSSGAVGDIDQATEMARKMVCEYGMSSSVGPIRYATKEQHVYLGGETIQPREFSEDTAQRIDQEVKTIIAECYEHAEGMLRDHTSELELLAQALLKHETLSAEEVDTILQAGSVDAVSKPSRNGKPVSESANGEAAQDASESKSDEEPQADGEEQPSDASATP